MKILYVTTIGITMGFFPEHIKMLLAEGHTVHLACNCTESKIPESYNGIDVTVHNIPFSRSPLSASNIKAYKALKQLVKSEGYDLVHTHTPNASVIARLACGKLRKNGLKVFYTAHGFHFYKGAPLLNWLLYYPIEKLCSYKTDALITINDEDYNRAKKKFHAKATEQISGIGVDLQRFKDCTEDRTITRAEFGIDTNEKVMVYIGELNKNKNQSVLLDVLAKLSQTRNDISLMLVGEGSCKEELSAKAARLGVAKKVVFTGYRKDIPRLLKASDVCVPSSIREGLGLNIIEAMASGVPVAAFDNRGHRTIIKDGENGFVVAQGDVESMAERVSKLIDDKATSERIIKAAFESAEEYSVVRAVAATKDIYSRNI